MAVFIFMVSQKSKKRLCYLDFMIESLKAEGLSMKKLQFIILPREDGGRHPSQTAVEVLLALISGPSAPSEKVSENPKKKTKEESKRDIYYLGAPWNVLPRRGMRAKHIPGLFFYLFFIFFAGVPPRAIFTFLS